MPPPVFPVCVCEDATRIVRHVPGARPGARAVPDEHLRQLYAARTLHAAREGSHGRQRECDLTWPAGAFDAPPVIALAVEAVGGFRSAEISANSATSTTVSVLVAAGATLLGIGVLAVGAAASGVTVHATATAA